MYKKTTTETRVRVSSATMKKEKTWARTRNVLSKPCTMVIMGYFLCSEGLLFCVCTTVCAMTQDIASVPKAFPNYKKVY